MSFTNSWGKTNEIIVEKEENAENRFLLFLDVYYCMK